MSKIEITDVRVRPYEKGDDKLKAFATITINNCFVIGDLKVITGQRGLFVAMPSKKRKDGRFSDIAHPLNQETRELIEQRVVDVYNEEMLKPQSERTTEDTSDTSFLFAPDKQEFASSLDMGELID